KVSGRKVAAEIFSIEPRDHAKARCLGQIQGITNRDDRRCHPQPLGFSNRQRRSDCVYFQYRRPTTDICQKLARWIFLTIKFNREIVRFTADRVCCVKGPGGIDEKSGACNFTVLVNAVNLNHRVGHPPKEVFNLLADRNSGWLLSVKKRNRDKRKTHREAESAD